MTPQQKKFTLTLRSLCNKKMAVSSFGYTKLLPFQAQACNFASTKHFFTEKFATYNKND
jgi:hypothetical protein